jgi:hypothetical protein
MVREVNEAMKRMGFLVIAMVGLLGCPLPHLTGSADSGTVKIGFSFSGAQGSRTVVPDFTSLVDQVEVTLTSNSGFAAPAAVVDTAAPWEATFTEMPIGSWNISVIARRAGAQIGTGSALNCMLTAAAPLTVTVPMTFSPVGTNGSVRFTVTFPASTGVDFVKGTIEESGAEATPPVTTLAGTSSATFEYPNLAAGTWSLVTTFHRGGAAGSIAGTFREKLVVISGFESAAWVDSTGALVSGGRAFSAEEFFGTHVFLGSLDIGGVLPATAFSSGTPTYALGPVPSLLSTVSFTATESVAGQYLRYSWNSGGLVEVKSGSPVTLSLSESNTLVVTVTAPDHHATKDYTVTFSKGYRVTYDGNGKTGGSVPADPRVYPAGTATVLGNTNGLTRSGCVFLGWALSAGAAVPQYTEGQGVPVNSNVTLYAVWGDIPPDVTNLEALAGTGTVTLTWTDPPIADLQLVRIEYTGGGPVEVMGGAQSVIITGLVPSQVYTFTLKAIDTTGLSSPGVYVTQAAGALGDGSYSFSVPGGTVGFTVSGGTIAITSCTGGVTSLDIPSQIGGATVTTIKSGSLSSGTITHLTFPPTLTTIEGYSISCPLLTDLVIPPSVTYIGGFSFYACSSLVSITIPASVTTLREVPFQRCTNLQAINVDPANPVCSSQDGVLFDKSGSTLLQYPGGKAGPYTIPSTCSALAYSAFMCAQGITSVVIPATVTSIDMYVFMQASNLAEVDIHTLNPPSLNPLDERVFSGNASGRIIKVPAASLDAYKTAWSNYASSIQAGTW